MGMSESTADLAAVDSKPPNKFEPEEGEVLIDTSGLSVFSPQSQQRADSCDFFLYRDSSLPQLPCPDGLPWPASWFANLP